MLSTSEDAERMRDSECCVDVVDIDSCGDAGEEECESEWGLERRGTTFMVCLFYRGHSMRQGHRQPRSCSHGMHYLLVIFTMVMMMMPFLLPLCFRLLMLGKRGAGTGRKADMLEHQQAGSLSLLVFEKYKSRTSSSHLQVSA